MTTLTSLAGERARSIYLHYVVDTVRVAIACALLRAVHALRQMCDAFLFVPRAARLARTGKMSVLAIILSLAAFAGLTGATYNNRVPLPPLNTFVTCYDPFKLSNGFYFPIERRPPPLIPLQETPQENFPTTQFQFPGNLWIPVPSG